MSTSLRHPPRPLFTRATRSVAIGIGALLLFAFATTLPRPAATDAGAPATEDWHGNVRASHWQPVSDR